MLRKRIEPYFHRTLRKQVATDIKYTQRKPLTQEYDRSDQEAIFYETMSEFLRSNSIFQNKNGQVNYLIVLVYWKLLASSVPAILGTLQGLAKRVEKEIQQAKSSQRKPASVSIIGEDEGMDEDIIELYKEQADEKEI